jgi:transcriptional regulator
MYVPKHFVEDDPARLAALIAAHDFATLVTEGEDGPFATHLPLLLDPARGRKGTLIGHVARANPHWRWFDGRRGLAIFAGAHAYVSPRWYKAAPAVPTWNYVAVHATGPVRAIEEPTALRAIIDRLAARYEGDGPWRLADQPARFTDGMLRGIVGLELAIERLEGKAKLSQNRSAEDRAGVVAALDAAGTPGARALADEMRRAERGG